MRGPPLVKKGLDVVRGPPLVKNGTHCNIMHHATGSMAEVPVVTEIKGPAPPEPDESYRRAHNLIYLTGQENK